MVTLIKRKKSILVCYTFGVRTKKEMLHVHVYFFLLQMGKTITKSTTKTTRQQATKWRQNDKSATMIQVDNRLLSPEQQLSSSSQIWHLLKL